MPPVLKLLAGSSFIDLSIISLKFIKFSSNTEIFNISELEDLKFNPIKKINKTYETEGLKYIEYRIDQYLEKGYERVQVTRQEYAEMLKWQEETGYQLVFPLVDTSNYTNPMHKTNDDLWYMVDNKGYPLDKNGKAVKDIEKI